MSIQGALIGLGLSALVGAAGSGYLVWQYKDGQEAKLRLAYAGQAVDAQIAARKQQKAQDDISLSRALADAKAQQKIVVRTVTLTKEIPVHVSDTAHCITFGLVRVLNAAAAQTDIDAVPAPAGEPDDACAPVSWRSFAADITDDYGAGNQNAQQLNDLIAWTKDQEAVAPTPPQ